MNFNRLHCRVFQLRKFFSTFRQRSRNLTTEFDCSLFTRRDGSKLYPGPQATLKNKPFLPGSTNESFPDTLSGPREDYPIFLEANSAANLTTEEWAVACREKLDKMMPKYSAVAFRKLPIESADGFSEFFQNCSYGRLNYVGGSGVRNEVRSQIYNASLEPPEYSIELHNEMSYSPIYNLKIMFFCLIAPPPGTGGISPICNNRDIFSQLDPAYVDKLRSKGIYYLRNSENSTVPGAASWQNAFETTSKQEAEQVLESRGMEWKWLDGDKLRFWYKQNAFTFHPETGEELWFNQIHSHHGSYYQAHPLFQDKGLSDAELPFHCTYGDGEEFEPQFLQQVREAGWRSSVGFPWQGGDLLVLDNMVAQHSRLSYTGPRKILVGMSSARTAGREYHGHRPRSAGQV